MIANRSALLEGPGCARVREGLATKMYGLPEPHLPDERRGGAATALKWSIPWKIMSAQVARTHAFEFSPRLCETLGSF